MVTNETPKKAVSANHIFLTFSNVWVETGNFNRRLKNRYFTMRKLIDEVKVKVSRFSETYENLCGEISADSEIDSRKIWDIFSAAKAKNWQK